MNPRRSGSRGRHGCLAALIALTPIALRSQQLPDRIAVFRFRDSLARLADTATLLAMESHGIDSARLHRNDALRHLRVGLIGLRMGELTGAGAHFRDAEGEFAWATELQPDWPLGWYALGNAELAEADAYPPALRTVFRAFGRDLYGPAGHDIARSAEVDSTFITGVVELGDDALRRGIGSHLDAALAALREVAPAPASRNRGVMLVRGRVERETGDPDSAIAMFRLLVLRDRADATAQLELARTLLATGRIGGVVPWYAGLAVADSAALAMYRLDLSLVMSDSALRAFDAAAGRARVAVARTFWDSRDPEALNGSAERLREHYRRMAYAHRHYPLVPPDHRYDSVRTFDPTGSRFDDRGRIYVRHGEPDAHTSLVLAGLPPNESWVYHRPAGDLLFNFAEPDSTQGYRMYESLLDIVGLGTAARTTGQGNVRARLDSGAALATYGAAWTAQAAQELLYSREKLSPLYGRMLSAGPQRAMAMQRAERVAGRKSIDVGLQTDSWKLSYELPLTADIDVVAVGSDSEGPELQVVFAIPGSSLYAPPSAGRVVYPIRTRVAVRNAAGQVVASVDTLRYFTADHPVPLDGLLLGRLPVQVPAGHYSVRVALETSSRGLLTQPRAVRVAALSAPAVDLSDLALGARSVPLPWRTGAADTAWINPLHRFNAGEPMQLFFEVGGLATGTAYKYDLAVFKDRDPQAQLRLGFGATALASPDPVHREIDLGRLKTGSYQLQVTITTASGQTVVRRGAFTVVK
ncbi:MAG: GWxTD domain-containing protein [Gemmatimonadales bacterium]